EGEQQPGVPPEIADEREVAFARTGEARERPGGIGEREVVVQAGDHLHAPAVAVREPDAVYGLRAADVRFPVARDRDRVLVGQAAGHARAPQQLVADPAHDELVDAFYLLQARGYLGVNSSDQLDQRFAEVGGDVRVLERR